MHRALRPGGDIADLDMLHSIGAPLDMVDEQGRTALYMAAATGYDEAVRWLLDHGADPSIVAEDKRSPLHAAAAAGHVTAVTILMENLGRRELMHAMQAVDVTGRTPAEIAAAARHLDVVRAMLAAEANSVHKPSAEARSAPQVSHLEVMNRTLPPAAPRSPTGRLGRGPSTHRGYLLQADSPAAPQANMNADDI